MEDQELCNAVASLLCRALKRGVHVTVQLWSCPRHCVRQRVRLETGGGARVVTRRDGTVAVSADCPCGPVVFEVKDGRAVAEAPRATWYELDAGVASQELFCESGALLLHCTRHVNGRHQWPPDDCAKCRRQLAPETQADAAATTAAETERQSEWDAIDRMLRYVKRKREFEDRAETVHDSAVRAALVKLLCSADDGTLWPHTFTDATLRWDPAHGLYVFETSSEAAHWVRVHCRERGFVFKCGGDPSTPPDPSWHTVLYASGTDLFMELVTEYYDTHPASPGEESDYGAVVVSTIEAVGGPALQSIL